MYNKLRKKNGHRSDKHWNIMRNRRTTDPQKHRTGATTMSYTSLAQSAVDWALSKVGCAYSQAQRTQEDIFTCSSLVARACSAR